MANDKINDLIQIDLSHSPRDKWYSPSKTYTIVASKTMDKGCVTYNPEVFDKNAGNHISNPYRKIDKDESLIVSSYKIENHNGKDQLLLQLKKQNSDDVYGYMYANNLNDIDDFHILGTAADKEAEKLNDTLTQYDKDMEQTIKDNMNATIDSVDANYMPMSSLVNKNDASGYVSHTMIRDTEGDIIVAFAQHRDPSIDIYNTTLEKCVRAFGCPPQWNRFTDPRHYCFTTKYGLSGSKCALGNRFLDVTLKRPMIVEMAPGYIYYPKKFLSALQIFNDVEGLSSWFHENSVMTGAETATGIDRASFFTIQSAYAWGPLKARGDIFGISDDCGYPDYVYVLHVMFCLYLSRSNVLESGVDEKHIHVWRSGQSAPEDIPAMVGQRIVPASINSSANLQQLGQTQYQMGYTSESGDFNLSNTTATAAVNDILDGGGITKSNNTYYKFTWYDYNSWGEAVTLANGKSITLSVRESEANDTMTYIKFFASGGTAATEQINIQSRDLAVTTLINGVTSSATDVSVIGNMVAEGLNVRNSIAEAKAALASVLGGEGSFLSQLTGTIGHLLSGGKIVYPKILENVTYGKTISVESTFTALYGESEAVLTNTISGLIHILTFALPRQMRTGIEIYRLPFILKAFAKGCFNCRMGHVSELSISYGGQDGDLFANEMFPTEIKVNFQIQPLISSLYLTPSSFKPGWLARNIGLHEFVASVAGLDISVTQTELVAQFAQSAMTDNSTFQGRLENAIANTFIANVSNLHMSSQSHHDSAASAFAVGNNTMAQAQADWDAAVSDINDGNILGAGYYAIMGGVSAVEGAFSYGGGVLHQVTGDVQGFAEDLMIEFGTRSNVSR